MLSKLLEKFSDGRVRSGLGQAPTSLRPPSVLRHPTRHARKGNYQAPVINPQPAVVVKARVTVTSPVKEEAPRGVGPGLFTVAAPFGVCSAKPSGSVAAICNYREQPFGAVAERTTVLADGLGAITQTRRCPKLASKNSRKDGLHELFCAGSSSACSSAFTSTPNRPKSRCPHPNPAPLWLPKCVRLPPRLDRLKRSAALSATQPLRELVDREAHREILGSPLISRSPITRHRGLLGLGPFRRRGRKQLQVG